MNLTVTLPIPAVQLVLDSLAKLPYEQSAPLIREIERQATEQIRAAQTAQAAPEQVKPEPDAKPEGDAGPNAD